ncbi:hypothetical protein BG015_000330 [Linnemannia schmuckeri]|uniref:Cystatin domain-containing protein n=1 Tax=Linnemannia schmuckeri TaxID=64567 RepID=A0A9P5VE98_9FUNG|nr:hypothetical protein BG015_000330 [Linnemannia schmuckeri]
MSATNASGGIGKPKPIDKKHPLWKSNPELKRLLHLLSSQIRSAYIRASSITDSSPTFEPVSYACQIVAGTNYYVKLRVTQHGWSGKHCDGGGDGKEYCHIRIFYQPWTNTTALTGISIRKTKNDPFEYDMPVPI